VLKRRDSSARQPRFCEPGHSTAVGRVLDYRLEKLQSRGLISGDWLDLGCADGLYTIALAERGASTATGIDPIPEVVERADARPHPANVAFRLAQGERLPFEAETFDGVLLNEVLEHVADEEVTLREVARVLRGGGRLALFSPNRWFPFEGHGARLSERRSLIGRPVPLMPWFPARLTRRFATARNYWPGQLRRLVTDAGLTVVESSWALAQFEQYPWLPERLRERYWRNVESIERSPAARLLAVSTFIIARA
jgi:SAM-dependent methyltransferase